jgi:membrane protease YdiL (CAAX protease family)
MPQPPIDPVFALFIGTLASASLATWFVLGRRRPILAYEPRDPVPWTLVAPLLILLLVLMRISSVMFGEEPPPLDELAGPLQMSNQILTVAAMQLAIFGTLLAATVVLSGATQRDVGLPEFVDQFGRDVKIGVVAWMAALLPVYAVQSLLAMTVGEESSHPLIRMVQREPSGPLMFVAFISAVIVAPICEECAFRLLLQGWLEKWEDRWLGWRTRLTAVAASTLPPVTDEVEPASPPRTIAAGSTAVFAEPIEPPRRGLARLPVGWAPILVSSLLFALAHLGYGPDPVALFVLAVMLGYVYQRTHRIIPCIVTHMLFNFTTLAILAFAAARGAMPE